MTKKSVSSLIDGLLVGDNRSVTKLITLVENDPSLLSEIYPLIFPLQRHAHVLGICGPQGTGKSTFIDGFISLLRSHDLKVGVIAIDPSSPYTYGALLGDRIRMQRHATDENVLIRSMATRGHIGGLSRATFGAVRVMGASGKDIVIVETVGIGQDEIDIVEVADTTVLVMMPGLGDQIQVLKAGIMEVGDIFVVNKADQEGAEKLFLEIQLMLGLNRDYKNNQEWEPSVVKTEAINQKGLEEFWETVKEHHSYLKANGLLEKKRKRVLVQETMEILSNKINDWAMGKILKGESRDGLADRICRMGVDPYTSASSIFEELGLKAQ